jgi:hypothetical protein
MTALAARWPACTGDAGDQRYAGPDGTRAGASVRAGRGWPFPEGQRLTFRRVTGWGGGAPTSPARSLFAPVRDPHGPEIRRPRTHSGWRQPENPPRTASALVSGVRLDWERRAVKRRFSLRWFEPNTCHQ